MRLIFRRSAVGFGGVCCGGHALGRMRRQQRGASGTPYRPHPGRGHGLLHRRRHGPDRHQRRLGGRQHHLLPSGSSSNGSAAASPYLYVQNQNGASFTYTINNNNSSETTNNYNISQGQHYTAYLIGREDQSDLRELQLILPAQQTGSTSGQATLRVLNAAPDAGFTPAVAPAAAVPGSITVTVGPTTFSPTTYAAASNYQTLAAGSNLP